MQGISSRLPPIGNGIHVSALQSREPPERSWSKFKKVLIDNPKDTNLLHRQKLWNFQKLNRGAFRSQVSSLPDIPYRVHGKKQKKKHNVGTQADAFETQTGPISEIRLILPKIIEKHLQKTPEIIGSPRELEFSRTKDVSCSPIQFKTPTSPDKLRNDHNNNFSLPPDVTFVDDPGYEYDSVVKKIDVSTMTDSLTPRYTPRRKPPVPKMKNIKDPSTDGKKKNVKFADEEFEEISEDDEMSEKQKSEIVEEIVREVLAEQPKEPTVILNAVDRPPTASSNISTASSVSSTRPRQNIGHTSQRTLDPLSVLDLLSGHRIGDARYMSTDHKNIKKSQKAFQEKPKKNKEYSNSEADRIWFQKIVGDKDVVDLGTYENFARTRPSNDSQSDSNNERMDANKASLKKTYTPRINGENPLSKPRGTRFYPIFSKDEPPRKYGGAHTPPRARNSRGRNSK